MPCFVIKALAETHGKGRFLISGVKVGDIAETKASELCFSFSALFRNDRCNGRGQSGKIVP